MSVKDWDKFIVAEFNHADLIGIKTIRFVDGTWVMIRKGKYII